MFYATFSTLRFTLWIYSIVRFIVTDIISLNNAMNCTKLIFNLSCVEADNLKSMFRIKLRVLDDTDSATFVLFERTVTSILNKSCSAMIESTNKITGPLSTNQLLLILWT
ncbi:unnamed protein product [Cuscuta europaea]|uniref:Replication factor A C-terminal domain-containing protein n=1 Tax=Cuscuta europaea TaxID=41803 RepID=A0A9P0ZCW7_CUSEU|nr:unnamed protein product [Cuscuta europaea]